MKICVHHEDHSERTMWSPRICLITLVYVYNLQEQVTAQITEILYDSNNYDITQEQYNPIQPSEFITNSYVHCAILCSQNPHHEIIYNKETHGCVCRFGLVNDQCFFSHFHQPGQPVHIQYVITPPVTLNILPGNRICTCVGY